MNVIMSNLSQQHNLDADQLQDRLPDYVPTTLRKTIVHSFKARMFPLHMFPVATQSTASVIDESAGSSAHAISDN